MAVFYQVIGVSWRFSHLCNSIFLYRKVTVLYHKPNISPVRSAPWENDRFLLVDQIWPSLSHGETDTSALNGITLEFARTIGIWAFTFITLPIVAKTSSDIFINISDRNGNISMLMHHQTISAHLYKITNFGPNVHCGVQLAV